MSNVIPFPRSYSGTQDVPPEVQIEEINRNVEMMKLFHVQETVQNLAPIIFNNLDVAGFAFADEDDADLKDGAFIVEAIRSILCKHYDIYHPFQQLSEAVFQSDTENPGALRIVDELAIELKKPDSE